MACGVLLLALDARRLRRRRSAFATRPPLADPEFLRAVRAEAADATLWLAVRRALADSCGVPAESVRPRDRLADLWNLRSDGPDFLDLLFRLERRLGVKIPRGAVESMSPGSRPEDFGDFAADVVAGLRMSMRP
ncbi:hypothetical protein [Paludisphaera soli]|uniref:hypothetical protein n=1 Tax=Paludisphaera soli TaxID=2712865 RepID=UPI0013ECBE7F|nr:hypothetical protein [Paludisphaera soli]